MEFTFEDKPAFRSDGVMDFKTFLVPHNIPQYREFMQAIKLGVKAGKAGKYDLEHATERISYEFFKPVLHFAGVIISGRESDNAGGSYIDSPVNLRFYGDGFKVFPGTRTIPGGLTVLDGFSPEVEFTLYENRILAVSRLRREGRSDLRVLENMALHKYSKPCTNLIPQVRRVGNKPKGILEVVPVFQMKQVLTTIKTAFDRMGKKNFTKLSDLAAAIELLQQDQNNSSVIPDLKRQYADLVETLAPRDL